MDTFNSLYWITGNKGGICKSFLAMLLIDFIIRFWGNKDLIVGDCEASDLQRTLCSVMLNTGLLPEEQIRVWNVTDDEGFEGCMDEFAAYQGKRIVADTGANMLPPFLRQIAFLAESLEDIHTRLNVIFVVGPAEESTDAAREYLQTVFKLTNIKTHFILIGPEELTKEDYHIMKSDSAADVRQAMSRLNIPAHFIGKVPERFFMQMMRGDRLPPIKLLEKLSGSMAAKRFSRWLADVSDPIFSKILEA